MGHMETTEEERMTKILELQMIKKDHDPMFTVADRLQFGGKDRGSFSGLVTCRLPGPDSVGEAELSPRERQRLRCSDPGSVLELMA